jgi:hypothetical protein
LSDNLFIDEGGLNKGLNATMSVQDAFTWYVNAQKWEKLKEWRFTLANPVLMIEDAVSNGQRVPSTVSKYPCQKFIKCYLPKPKGGKTRWAFESGDSAAGIERQPEDFNYVVHTIILCKNMGGSGSYNSNHWNVQCNGLTAIQDE